MNKKYFCTLFDRNYLFKGVAMINSLVAHCPNALIYVLCMDDVTKSMLDQLNNAQIATISLDEVETKELLIAKRERGVAEYCWTLSPCLPFYLLLKYSNIDLITYLDADLFFYSSLEPLFDEIKNSSIAIIEHRFIPRLKPMEVMGRFCVQWVSFRNDEQGMACLKKWRDQCIEWCFYRLEDGKMGDQKYLDDWPNLYSQCKIIEHLGAGVAPWNYSNYNFSKKNTNLYVDQSILIFYHFHQFQIFKDNKFDRLSEYYTQERKEPNEVYVVYEQTINSVIEEIQNIDPGFEYGMQSYLKTKIRRWVQFIFPIWVKNILRYFVKM